MSDPVNMPKEVIDLINQRAEEWKSLFFWGVGGMATGYAILILYLKGIISEAAVAKAEAAKGDLAQAESNKAVASALEKLAEAVRHGRT